MPLYDKSRIGQQLDEILTDKPLDNATRQIIRRTGLKPSDFFTKQMKLHGVPLTPEIQQKLRTLDGSDLVSQASPASGEGSGGMGLILPNVSKAQRLWDVFNSGTPAARNAPVVPGGAVIPSSLGAGSNGLLALIRSGEGSWNSVNRGRAGDSSPINLVSMTIGSVEQMQQRNKVFAVGAYQFTPDVLSLARREAGLSPSDLMSPENQNKMAMALIFGSKRPALAAYVTGKSNNLNAAHYDIAREWAALQAPNGRGMYDGDKAGNMASIPAAKVQAMLIRARQEYLSRGR